ncbi:hypothetical protein FQA39_LY19085 [Lamprigera yunnana]|nr:hypothetical protein FQA39_LY19085 [Lamprigera yunnana]
MFREQRLIFILFPACNCNNFSTRCYFDKDLYERTGHGGHCLDCAANRDGPNCERCRENYYQREDQYCVACNCDPIGSRSLQCNSEAEMPNAKPGVTGDKCERCDVNYFDFSVHGCKLCGCSEEGSADNVPNCDPYTGVCTCKENVEGNRCRECKPGFFNLDRSNDFGCTPCFCYGHSSECLSAVGYSKYQFESSFTKSAERWQAQDGYRRSLQETIIFTFLAPDRFLGDQRASYNQLFEFTLRIGDNRAVPTATDIIFEGANGYVTNTIFAQRNLIPSTANQNYKFRLHEHPNYGWQPRLSARAFISILTNLTAIRIRGTYTSQGVGFLDNVKLETAARGGAGFPALWIEHCECPTGYVGPFCESCAPGYRHSPAHGGPFSPCVPCECNKHAELCELETGRCICEHNTAGDNCEFCARGYYGNALGGTPYDCQACGCPNGGACIQLDEDIIMCVECPTGYSGHRCDLCSDGYFGDPLARFGIATPCQPCECNLNIDTNAIGNCNTTTGECLKCIHNTGGSRCEQCLPGFYGDALALPKGDCKPCQCFPSGTEEYDWSPICDQISGDCRCKPHVQGLQDGAKRHVHKLERLIDILDKIERNPTVIDDENFEEQLRVIQEEIDNLLDATKLRTGGDEQTIVNKLDYIRKRQDKIANTLEEIEENIYLAQDIGEETRVNLTYCEENIESADSELKSAIEIKMTTIAHEARQLSDDLDNNAENIIKTASEAKNKSIEAYELAKNASDLQRNITQDVRLLKHDVTLTQGRLANIKQWTEDVFNKSQDAKTKALILLNEVSNLMIPKVDARALKKQVEGSKEEAKRILNETDILFVKSEMLLNEVGEQVLTAEDLLNRGVDQMDVTTDLLSDIDLAKAQAERAIVLAKDILNEAAGTYETVSRKSALATAVQANELANKASQTAQKIRNEAEFLHQNATNLKREAGFMSDRVGNTESEFEKLFAQTLSNETLINEAKDKIGRAGKDSSEATKKVNEIIMDIETIMKNLQGLPKLDDGELNRLEEELMKAERKVHEANLDTMIEKLQKEHKEQNQLVEYYTAEVEWLKKEVANVREIANALPDGCFKRVQLEP